MNSFPRKIRCKEISGTGNATHQSVEVLRKCGELSMEGERGTLGKHKELVWCWGPQDDVVRGSEESLWLEFGISMQCPWADVQEKM